MEKFDIAEHRLWMKSLADALDCAATPAAIAIETRLLAAKLRLGRYRNDDLNTHVDNLHDALDEARGCLVAHCAGATAETIAKIDSLLSVWATTPAALSVKKDLAVDTGAERLALEVGRAVTRVYHDDAVEMHAIIFAIIVLFSGYLGQLSKPEVRATIRAMTETLLRLELGTDDAKAG